MEKSAAGEEPLKFKYLKTSPFFIKTISFFGLLLSLLMLSGLVIIGIGHILFLIIFSPLILILFFFYASHYIFNFLYKKISISSHTAKVEKYWGKNNKKPSVDIFITYSGEGIEIIRETCRAAANMDYDNMKIYLLDDSGEEQVRILMEEMGISYLCRPDRGHMKKAGNLTYALKMTDGEFIAIFDADFVPGRDFIRELLPYFSDEKAGLIQSPQFFIDKGKDFKKNFLTSGGAVLQEDFYRIIQTARNHVHGAICVGTNLIYRRSSLKDAGGIAYVPWCEDLETGFNITASGYHILYLPIILARGRSPDNPQSYFNQHRRWCYSSLRLLFTKKMFSAKLGSLTRLSYLSNISYYFAEALSIFSILLFCLVMIFDRKLIDTSYFIFFIPYFIFLIFIQPMTRLKMINIGAFLASSLDSVSYLYTMLVMIFTRKLNWIPSNKREGTISAHFFSFIVFTGIILGIESYTVVNFLFINIKTITFRQWTTYAFAGWFIMIVLIQAYVFLYILSFTIFRFISGRRARRVKGGSNVDV